MDILTRAQAAAMAYARRSGFEEVETTEIVPPMKTKAFFTASKDGEKVFFSVSVHRSGVAFTVTASRREKREAKKQGCFRVDLVNVLILAEDRALMRHVVGEDL